MAEIKFTKSELRAQQNRLSQLEKYLPTLQLKKAMLQTEVSEARVEIIGLEKGYQERRALVDQFSPLLSQTLAINPELFAKVTQVKKHYENIAGVEVPYYEGITFADLSYSLVETPPWIDSAIVNLRNMAEDRAKIKIVEEKKAALEDELRQVSIRVNLFEKILIPRTKNNIKRIKVFLGDLQLAAVSRAKSVKTKIEKKNRAEKTLKLQKANETIDNL
jgi:V/A-type H+-transporting ATPase subunit D